ncbi:MAG: hypothetical protein LUH14_00265 [Clostridiaceae bacterium]|nr:hypothetical protein [Clostridiaceae bacterium]
MPTGKITAKQFAAALLILLLLLFAAFWMFNRYQNGVKKIVFPLIQGDNEYTDAKQIQEHLEWLDSLQLEEVEYDEELDPSLASGNRDCFILVFNSGEEESYLYDTDYLLIEKGDKKQLYRIAASDSGSVSQSNDIAAV